jgi:plasmid stabilization system protein ParE
VAQDDPRAAAAIVHQIDKTVDRIARLPLSARVIHEDDIGPIRAVLVGRYKFRILYVQGDELIVRNVRRTRRQQPWEGR